MTIHALLLALAAAAPIPALPDSAEPVRLSFHEFFVPSPRELKASPRLRALQGKRVKLVGFMAKLEVAPLGAFYLTPTPVVCDEAGGGTADLPPDAVYVIVRSLQGQPIPFAAKPLELTGVLELGHRVEPDGRSTQLRLTLDQAGDANAASEPKVPGGKKPTQRTAN